MACEWHVTFGVNCTCGMYMCRPSFCTKHGCAMKISFITNKLYKMTKDPFFNNDPTAEATLSSATPTRVRWKGSCRTQDHPP